VAREHGVNANQVFQWWHEYRKGTLDVGQQGQAKLMPVTVTAEPSSVTGAEIPHGAVVDTFVCLRFWDLATLPNKSFVS
jgi:hypothetical protein